MKIYVKRIIQGFAPADDSEFQKLQDSKIKLGEVVEIYTKKPRNLKFHRKFFSMLQVIFENQDVYTDREDLRHDLTVQAGYYRKVIDLLGNETKRAESISFANMDDAEFNIFYNDVVNVACLWLSKGNEKLARELAENF